ncbi:DUF1622 domain-containing protein [Nonomuraea cypriaca]|uniref:DUF1622 domain-containing protein n=1 Tax=Nonomuraea cypriaca TaxID=1187855 RepID=UPI001A9C3549|nr:DUF1622 domain-containing protein [Nonomuraea cypriaca]
MVARLTPSSRAIEAGATWAFAQLVVSGVVRMRGESIAAAAYGFNRIRLTLDTFLALGLEFQLAGDILRAAIPTARWRPAIRLFSRYRDGYGSSTSGSARSADVDVAQEDSHHHLLQGEELTGTPLATPRTSSLGRIRTTRPSLRSRATVF